MAGKDSPVAAADVPGLVLGVHVLAANVREHVAAAPLLEGLEAKKYEVVETQSDRGYLPSDARHGRAKAGMRLVSKPPVPSRQHGRLGKQDFAVDVEAGETGEATCPSGTTVPIRRTTAGLSATIPRSACRSCDIADICAPPKGQKKIAIHRNELKYQRWARELRTPEGRAARRERVAVEHSLARLGAVQGRRARYRGLDKTQFHTEACAVVVNCYVLVRQWQDAA